MGRINQAVVIVAAACLLLVLLTLRVSERTAPAGRVEDRKAKLIEPGGKPAVDTSVTRLDTQDTISHLEFTAPSVGWACTFGGIFYKTTDGGASWRRVDARLPFSGRVVSLHFASDSSGWVILQRYRGPLDEFEKSEGWLLHTKDGGQSWQVQFAGRALELLEVKFYGEREGWVIGASYFSDGKDVRSAYVVLRSGDGGISWKDVSGGLNRGVAAQSDGEDSVADAVAFRSNGVSLLTGNGLIITTGNLSETWEVMGRLDLGIMIFKMLPTAKGSLRFLGGMSGQHGTSSLIAERTSKGTWVRNRIDDLYLKDAIYLSEQHVLACGSKSIRASADGAGERKEGILVSSSDGGLTWKVVYKSEQAESLDSLSVSDSEHIWAGGAGGQLLRLKTSGLPH